MQKKKPVKSRSGRRKFDSRRKDSWEDRESRDMKRDDRKDSTNDPKWYATDPALLRDSASIPFSWPLGQRWTTVGRDYPGTTAVNYPLQDCVPGLMVMKLLPTFGAGLNSNALNTAASSTYTFVRHTNAGHANYDPNDLMLYIIAMTNVYSFVNYAMRIYAIATLYEQRNRYLPDTLFTAMGIDADSIKNNLADYRFALNVLINKISSIAVPASMSIFLRHAMLYSYVYSEGTSVKDQLYMYTPMGFLKFGLDEDKAGCLTLSVPTASTPGSLMSWRDIINFGNDLFDAIWEQEDFGIMSGDILKAYGSNILTIKSLDEVIPFSTVYDPMVLHQMKNATPFSFYDPTTFGIFQNSTKSKLDVVLEANGIAESSMKPFWYNVIGDRTLSLDSDSPTPEMVIEATRLMSGIVDFVDSSPSNKLRLWAGSEMVVETEFYGKVAQVGTDSDSNLTIRASEQVSAITNGSASWSAIEKFAYTAMMVKNFKYAPTVIFPLMSGSGSGDVIGRWVLREVDNYAVLSENDIQKMHTAAILNLLNVPSVAKNVTV